MNLFELSIPGHWIFDFGHSTLLELEYGVYKSQHSERNALNLLRFLTPFAVGCN
jgi:hypothetical protein